MRITIKGQSPLDIPTGHNIDMEYWDKNTERVIDGVINKYNISSEDINRTLDEYKTVINEIFARYELLEKRIPSSREVKDLFNDMIGHSQPDLPTEKENFFSIFDLFTKTMGEKNQWTRSTFAKFASTRKHLMSFDPNLEFTMLNDDKMQEYVKHLNNHGMRNTTVSKNLSFVRWFLRWATRQGYYTGTVHETFKPKLKGTGGSAKEIIYLEWEELLSLYDLKFPASRPSLEAVRDVFCFCCFTGLRYSDVAKLRRSDIKKDFIKVVTEKTIDGLIIELNKYSRAILKKYENVTLPDDKALPVISNQKMNEYLKVMGKIAGIEEPIRIVYFIGNVRHEEVYPKYALLHTHCGRSTFVINGLRMGIPAEVIMKWTGHSDYESMKPYIKIVDKLKVAEMDKFNKIM